MKRKKKNRLPAFVPYQLRVFRVYPIWQTSEIKALPASVNVNLVCE